jgi:hypothetical protein
MERFLDTFSERSPCFNTEDSPLFTSTHAAQMVNLADTVHAAVGLHFAGRADTGIQTQHIPLLFALSWSEGWLLMCVLY